MVLCVKLLTCLIVQRSFGNKTLQAIFGFFFVFWLRLKIYLHSCWFMKGLICANLWGWFLIFFNGLVWLLVHPENTHHHYFWVYCCFLDVIQSGESMYDLSYDTCNAINMIKNKFAVSHWLFWACLIPVSKWIKKLFNNFICIFTNHDFSVTTWNVSSLFHCCLLTTWS